jgi:hypothetical protein
MMRAVRFAVLAAGLGLGVFSMAVARGGAGYSFSGSSAFRYPYRVLPPGVTVPVQAKDRNRGCAGVAAMVSCQHGKEAGLAGMLDG